MIKKTSHAVSVIETAICSLLILEMTIAVFWGVVTRYITKGHGQIPWLPELASYSLAWVTFLGASLVMYYGGHLVFDGLVEKMPPTLKKVIIMLVYLTVIACILVFVISGFEMVGRTREQISPAMQVSVSWAYLSIPIGFSFMLVHVVEKMVDWLSDLGGER